MSTTTSITPRNKWMRWGSFAAVVLVPLAFAGLFVASLGQGNKALDNIPVAIVNQDTLQQIPKPDGTVQNVFAGRQLVTELTGSKGFNWTITNESQAAADLKDGTVYAILTVPSDFSTSILSLTGNKPVKANISIKTDDSHSYLTGSVAQVVGQTMTDTFGRAITAQYIGGIYAASGASAVHSARQPMVRASCRAARHPFRQGSASTREVSTRSAMGCHSSMTVRPGFPS
jgi:putative membrane protein